MRRRPATRTPWPWSCRDERKNFSTVAPKLRAKRASRVVELLLSEDCVAPSRAAKCSGLSDRAARRLFDRLVRLGRRARNVGATELPALRFVRRDEPTRKRRSSAIGRFDAELADLPQAARWREWMLRVEAAIFAGNRTRAARGLGAARRAQAAISTISSPISADELRARPYDLVFVAGGYQLRTKPRFADAIRAANAGSLRDAGAAGADADRAPGRDGDRLSAAGDARANLAACREGDQPRRHRRAEASWPHRRELTRAGAGAPFAYVTTKRFLEVFGLASLRHLPDIERLEDEGLLRRPQSDIDLDDALGILGEDDPVFEGDMEFDEADEI